MKKYLILIQLVFVLTLTSCFSTKPSGDHIQGKPYHHVTDGFLPSPSEALKSILLPGMEPSIL